VGPPIPTHYFRTSLPPLTHLVAVASPGQTFVIYFDDAADVIRRMCRRRAVLVLALREWQRFRYKSAQSARVAAQANCKILRTLLSCTPLDHQLSCKRHDPQGIGRSRMRRHGHGAFSPKSVVNKVRHLGLPGPAMQAVTALESSAPSGNEARREEPRSSGRERM
jgi:hypothetical protein